MDLNGNLKKIFMFKDIKIGNFLAEKDENGLWVYKADNKPFKLNGTLKKTYSDMPRFKAIIETEAQLMEDYNNSLKESVKEMANILHFFGH